jgi:general secretion pathway protein K
MRADVVRARRKVKRRTRERGMALIMVLLAIVVLTVFLTEVQQQSSTSFAAALASRDRIKAEYAAKSAVNLTRLLISTEPTVRQAAAPMLALLAQTGAKVPQIPVWAYVDQLLAPYNCEERHEGFKDFAGVDLASGEGLGLGEGTCFDVVVVDEDGLINVNAAARSDSISKQTVASQLLALLQGPQYDPLFSGEDLDGQITGRQELCAAIIDWADYDEDGEPCQPFEAQNINGGAEDNYYQSVGLDYFRKNAGFDSLEELRMVRGMGDDIWATFVDPNPSDPTKRVLTVWGQGKVNVNTANAQTILALVCSDAWDSALCTDPLQQAAFLQLVTLIRGFTMGLPLFGSSKDFIKMFQGGGLVGPYMEQMGIEPVQFKGNIKNYVGTKSKIFSIYAEGVTTRAGRETRLNVHAVVDFRNATELSNVNPLDPAAGANGQPGQTPALPGQQPGQNPAQDPLANASPDTIMAALNSNPAGQVIYYRSQ